MGLSAILLLIPHESVRCQPLEEGGELCSAAIGPGPFGPVAGVLFLAGLAAPGVGLIVLAAHTNGPAERIAFLAAGVSLVGGVLSIAVFVLLVGTV